MTTCFCVKGFAQTERSQTIITIEDDRYYIHTVQKGDTFYSLSKLYDVSESDIVKDNMQTIEGLKAGQAIKIKVQPDKALKRLLSKRKQSKIFDYHRVIMGETTYSICKAYGIDLNVLLMDNPSVDPSALAIGTELKIRKSDAGSQSDHQIIEQIGDYVDASNSVTDDFILHAVEKGETIYSLSKEYNVSQQEIEQINKLDAAGLKIGMMIRLPRVDLPEDEQAEHEPQVDSSALFRPYGLGHRDMPQMGDVRGAVHNMKQLNYGDVLNIALMLPLSGESLSQAQNFKDFYQGVLLALEDMKKEGMNVRLNLYNTQHSEQAVAQAVNSYEFEATDLIIGPIYEKYMRAAVDFAERNGVAIVSPLATMNSIKSSVLYQIAPSVEHKYDKLKYLLADPRNNVVLISTAKNDATFVQEVMPELKPDYKTINYSKNLDILAVEEILSDSLNNVFVVLSSEEILVEEILARLSSVKNNLNARSISVKPISVVGSSRLMRFQNIDKNLFFKLDLHLVSSYYADRSNARVGTFDKRYIAEFSALPTLYSYRGYDVTKLFVSNLEKGYEGNLLTTLNSSQTPLLQAKYNFRQSSLVDNNFNDQWVLINYSPNYTIKVK